MVSSGGSSQSFELVERFWRKSVHGPIPIIGIKVIHSRSRDDVVRCPGVLNIGACSHGDLSLVVNLTAIFSGDPVHKELGRVWMRSLINETDQAKSRANCAGCVRQVMENGNGKAVFFKQLNLGRASTNREWILTTS